MNSLDLTGKSISYLRELSKKPGAVTEEFLEALAGDERKGVQDLLNKLRREQEAELGEKARLAKLFAYEKNVMANGYSPVAGVDEVGRGPLAGPVLAAAVILPQDWFLPGLNDSKKLTPQKREDLAAQIKEQATAWAVGLASVEEINQLNIFQAALLAMRRAIERLHIQPAYVLVDGFRLEELPIPQIPLVGGDRLSASIAAASIVAKVERDAMMNAYHRKYPEYGFIRHKGYGTKEHLEALERHGPCTIHRRDFQPVARQITNYNAQITNHK